MSPARNRALRGITNRLFALVFLLGFMAPSYLSFCRLLAMKSQARDFICHRRDRSADMARLARDNLPERGFDAFIYVEDLKSARLNKSLLQIVEAASDLVVVLSPGSLEGYLDKSSLPQLPLLCQSCGVSSANLKMVDTRNRNRIEPHRLKSNTRR